MFSGGRERVHWERMGLHAQKHKEKLSNLHSWTFKGYPFLNNIVWNSLVFRSKIEISPYQKET